MNTKQWAVFFVALLSVDYAAAFFFGGYRGVSDNYAKGKDGYYGWSQGCRCNEDLTSSLDEALEKTRGHLGRYESGFSLKDANMEEYELSGGNLRGLHRFERKGPYRCSLSRKYVRVYFSIGFFRLLCNYSISLAEDLLGGFLGGIASVIGDIVGSVTDFLFRIAIPDVYVTCVLNQRLGSRRGFELEGLYMNNIENISFLNKRFSRHQDSIGSYFRPIFDHVLRAFFQEEFGGILIRYFSRVTVEKDMFYYESNSRKSYRGGNKWGRQYEESDESDESEGSSSYSTYEYSESYEE